MRTDISEKGLESLIVADMTEGGWIVGDSKDYEREYAVDQGGRGTVCNLLK